MTSWLHFERHDHDPKEMLSMSIYRSMLVAFESNLNTMYIPDRLAIESFINFDGYKDMRTKRVNFFLQCSDGIFEDLESNEH